MNNLTSAHKVILLMSYWISLYTAIALTDVYVSMMLVFFGTLVGILFSLIIVL